MKVVHITANFSPSVGGVESYVSYLTKQLSKKCQVAIITARNNNSLPKEERKDNLMIIRVPIVVKLWSYPLCAGIFQALRKGNYDIIHIHVPSPSFSEVAVLYSLLFHKPTVVTYHGDLSGSNIPRKLLATLYNFFSLKLISLSAGRFIATTQKYVDKSMLRYIQKEKIENIPIGVDTSRFSAKSVYSETKKILFVGKLSKYTAYKGLADLIKALQFVRNGELIVVGGGDYVSHYRKLAKILNLKNRIRFVGHVPNEGLPQYYSECDIFVLPSILESFGVVLIEAMACGKPVVSTNVGGASEIIEHGKSGLIVPQSNPKALADAINFLLENPDTRDKMGRYGRELCEKKYNWETISSSIYETYKSSLE